MNKEETLDRILMEVRTKSILPTPDYTPTVDHYVPIRFLKYYLELAYTIGYEEALKKQERSFSKKVAQIKDGKIIKIWPSMEKAGKFYEVGRTGIYKAANGITKSSAGFQWKKLEDLEK